MVNFRFNKEVCILLILLLPIVSAQDTCSAALYLGENTIDGELLVLNISTFSVNPTSEQVGTIFSLSATVTDVASLTSVLARVYQGDLLIDEVGLYDDGSHGDGSSNDGVFGGVFDSRIAAAGAFHVHVLAINEVGQQSLSVYENAFSTIETDCKAMSNAGPQDPKLDVVFIPCDYSVGEEAKFAQDAQAHWDELIEFSPFDEYTENINAWRVDRLGEVNCYHEGRCVYALTYQTEPLADECGSWDKIIVLSDSTAWEGCAYLNGQAHSSSRYPWITVHEFGHSFGGLYDEYLAASSGWTNSAPNCDPNAGCPKWAGVEGAGCFSGCYSPDMYRSIDNGTMRLSLAQDFGVVNKNHLRGRLDAYD